MITSEFIKWMIEEKKYPKNTAISKATSCKKVWAIHGNLDQHYRRDNGEYIIYLLTYSSSDHKNGIDPKHSIPIGGNKYTNTATYMQVSKLYMEFKEYQDLQKFSNI